MNEENTDTNQPVDETERTGTNVEVDMTVQPSNFEEQILEALKELTKHIGDLTKVINAMKESHDKWVRAGKF